MGKKNKNYIFFNASNPLIAHVSINCSFEEIQYLDKKAKEQTKLLITAIKEIYRLPDGKFTAVIELVEEVKENEKEIVKRTKNERKRIE